MQEKQIRLAEMLISRIKKEGGTEDFGQNSVHTGGR